MPEIRSVAHPNFIVRELKKLSKAQHFAFASNPKEIDYTNEWAPIDCGLGARNFDAQFTLQQMPGCCAVLIVHHLHPKPFTNEPFLEVLEILKRAAYDAGFGSILMAQVGLPETWQFVIDTGWTASQPFINGKSGNPVIYLSLNLNQPGKRKGFEF